MQFEECQLTLGVYACVVTCVQLCSEEQLLVMIHETGLISKLKGTMSIRTAPILFDGGPHDTINRLSVVWTQKARSISRDLFKKMQGETERKTGSHTVCAAC
jgi:hypothetical protein